MSVELPCVDPRAALPEYTDVAVNAIGSRRHLVVGRSLGVAGAELGVLFGVETDS